MKILLGQNVNNIVEQLLHFVMRLHEHILIIGFLSLHFHSSEKKKKMLNEPELKRLPTSVFSEKVPTNSIPQPLRTNCTGATVQFQNKLLVLHLTERIKFPFSACEEY